MSTIIKCTLYCTLIFMVLVSFIFSFLLFNISLDEDLTEAEMKRIHYYFPQLNLNNVTLKHVAKFSDPRQHFDIEQEITYDKLNCFLYFLNSNFGSYYYDICNILEHSKYTHEVKIPISFGDAVGESTSFYKARSIGSLTPLLPLKTQRHTFPGLKFDPFSWEEKINDVVWVGTSTGAKHPDANIRLQFVMKNFENHKDLIHFDHFGQNKWGINYTKYAGPRISIREMLKYKYLISLEGNDIATNLIWILSSNSVPIMPHPTKETWFMYGLLKPYVHYVPLDLKKPVEETLQYCEMNDCKTIAKHSKDFAMQFMSKSSQYKIAGKIIDLFYEKYQMNEK